MGFKDHFNNPPKQEVSKTPEDHFYDAVGVKIKSLNAFISYLLLNDYIKTDLKDSNKKTVSWYDLPYNKKILYLVNKVPTIKQLAQEFSQKWG